ncbi:glutamate receptor ionotropic, kainate 5-like [Macrobrachium nipponense]|uniref:glutamate receptor ionotropic, kainate 5-like n=1 Tax=Macrobrachium nipponense TaxID=159736 RepID=UPI0030C81667
MICSSLQDLLIYVTSHSFSLVSQDPAEMYIITAMMIVTTLPGIIVSNLHPTEIVVSMDDESVQKITESFTGDSLQFLYNQHYEDTVTKLVKSLPKNTSGHMSLINDGRAETLKQMFELSTTATILVLLETPSNVINIFIKIKEKMLKCHKVQWLLIMEGKEATQRMDDLEYLVPEGTHVTILIKDSNGSLKAFLPFVDTHGITRFMIDDKGLWGQSLRNQLFKTRSEHYSLNGRQLTVVVMPLPSSVNLGKMLSDGRVEVTGGVEINIINNLSSTLNFTYKAYLSPDKNYGQFLPNGTATGIIGSLASRKFTFGCAALSISQERVTVVDFTAPTVFSRYMLFSRFPERKNTAFAVLNAYQFQVWVFLSATVLLIGPITFLVSLVIRKYLENDTVKSIEWYSLNMFRSIVNQGNDIETESWSLRFILFVWFGVCLVFSALYSGVLTAVLAVPSYETPIDSLSDLPRATKDGFTIGLLGGSSYEVLFKSAKDGLYKQTWDLMDHKDRSKSFVSGMDEGMKRVLERKFVFVAGEVFMSLYLRKYGYGRFYFGRERFFPGYVGFAFQMGSPITPVFTHLGASSGSQVFSPIEGEDGQVLGFRHAATDHHNDINQQPEMSYRGRNGQARKENKEIWRCYIRSNPAEIGYRRMRGMRGITHPKQSRGWQTKVASSGSQVFSPIEGEDGHVLGGRHAATDHHNDSNQQPETLATEVNQRKK